MNPECCSHAKEQLVLLASRQLTTADARNIVLCRPAAAAAGPSCFLINLLWRSQSVARHNSPRALVRP
jgi:hypothetical protein